MRILIIGAAGLVGSHIAEHLDQLEHEVATPGRQDVDILDISTLERALAGNIRNDATAFDVVINCAAHTNTDLAEDEPNLAQLLNADAAGNVARCCYRRQVRLIHMSTELVLGGSDEPQGEGAPYHPVGVYARTKAEGEENVLQQTAGNAVVLRTCSVYGHGGRNWASAIAGKLLDGQGVKADSSRVVQPNSAIEVSRRVGAVVARPGICGVLHSTGVGQTTWAEWASILADQLGADPGSVRPFNHAYRVARPNVLLACERASSLAMEPMAPVLQMLTEYAAICLEVGA